ERERRALVRTGAGGRHRAAVQFRKPFGEGKSQAEAGVTVVGAGVRSPEAIEHVGEQVTGDSGAGVRNLDVAESTYGTHRQVRPSATRREFDGVAQQMPDDLLQPPGLTEDDAIAGLESLAEGDSLARRMLLLKLDRGFDDLAQIGLFRLDAHLAAGDGAEVEQIVDDVSECACVAGDRVSAGTGLALTQMTVLEQPRPSQYCVQWGAQFMCQRLQEFILEPACALGFRARGTLVGENFIDVLVHASAGLWRLRAPIASP